MIDKGIQKGLVRNISARNRAARPTSTSKRLDCRKISRMHIRKNKVNLSTNFAHLRDLLEMLEIIVNIYFL